MDEAFRQYADRVAYSFMGKDIGFAQTDALSRAFAAYLQGQGLVKGDRVAIMMPDVPQYPVVVAAVLRAGFVVVNVNPLYTPRELEHQLKDSGCQGHRHHRELCHHAAKLHCQHARQACGAVRHG